MSKKGKIGIVYMAISQSLEDDIIKIGTTGSETVHNRIQSLSLSIPYSYQCVRAIKVSNALEVESALLGIMKPFHFGDKSKREFFKIDENQFRAINNLMDAFRHDPKFEDVTPPEEQYCEDKNLPLDSKRTTFFKFSESKMKVKNGKKWITKGSKVSKDRTKSFEKQDRIRNSILSKTINAALNNGILKDKGDEYYEVSIDWEIDSAYIAASVVSGGWCSNRKWKEVKTSKDYADWKHEMLAKEVTSEPQK